MEKLSALTRRSLLKTLGGVAVATVLRPDWLSAAPAARADPGARGKAGARQPNLIFILADDVGLDGLSCYGGNFQTPNLDALARGGTRFEYCYASPLCGPSRAELLSGRYAFRTGMETNHTGNVLTPANETLLPRVMKTAGYSCVSVGKWDQLPLQPSDWGFDEYFRFHGSGVYWSGKGPSTTTINGVTQPIPKNRYVPDMMHDFLIDFITRHQNEPFCAYYPMSHVHGKIVRTPDSKPGSRTLYADNIAYMDKLVGKLVAELDRLGLRENTLIVFTGDNGTAQKPAQKGTVNGQKLSGAKNTLLEGGSRVPLIANWPGTTPAGAVCHDLTDFSDIMPTFAALGGADVPTGKPIDGQSFAPQIRGQIGTPREWVYVELNGARYVTTKAWKLNGSGELFDMSGAPFVEKLVPATTLDPQAMAARQHLQGVLDGLVGNQPAPTAAQGKNKAARKAARQGKAGRPGRKKRRRALAAP